MVWKNFFQVVSKTVTELQDSIDLTLKCSFLRWYSTNTKMTQKMVCYVSSVWKCFYWWFVMPMRCSCYVLRCSAGPENEQLRCRRHRICSKCCGTNSIVVVTIDYTMENTQWNEFSQFIVKVFLDTCIHRLKCSQQWRLITFIYFYF